MIEHDILPGDLAYLLGKVIAISESWVRVALPGRSTPLTIHLEDLWEVKREATIDLGEGRSTQHLVNVPLPPKAPGL